MFHDSGGTNRFLIFTTVKNLHYLSSCSLWLSDGTFSTVPSIFDQLYTIHGVKVNEDNPQSGKALPLVYALMPNRKRRTYNDILNVLKEAQPLLNPDILMIDFERAFSKAFAHNFLDAEIKGCHFHFGQCVYRCVQQCGKQVLYGTDVDFALAIKMLVALAFVPVQKVVEAFEALKSSVYFTRYGDDLIEIIEYFAKTWIGLPNRRGLGAPLFDLGMWNCYDSVINNLPRTNNGVEGWHSAFRGRVEVAHASMGKFINCIKDEQNLTEVMME